jgi:hypothetical protein
VGSEGHDALIGALRRFLGDAANAIDWERARGDLTRLAVQALAQSLAALSTCIEAGALAHEASFAVGYLLPEPAGRSLDADALISTGLVGMLLAHADVDLQAVASDLAGYLAGPATDIWDYAIFDGHGTLQDPIPVVDGWELVTPSADELRLVLPLPSTAAYQPDQPFDPDSYRRLVMLRHVVRDGTPQRGPALHWDYLYSLGLGRPQWELLWQSLTVLSLYANPVLRLWARYRIEPRRRTDKLFDSVDWEIWSPDGEAEIETPRTGAFDLDAHDAPMLRRFLDALSPCLTAALDTQGTKKVKKRAKEEAANRLQRCAEHFLIAGEHTYDEGEAVPGEEDDAILHYVIALEVLLGGREGGDLTRKISQRAAILVGTNDVERLAIRRLVCDAYKARSDYAHGNKPSMIGKIDLAKLRRVVRHCILARLILGDPTQVGPLHELADRALLSHSELQNQIRRPFDEFAQRAGLADRTPDYPA